MEKVVPSRDFQTHRPKNDPLYQDLTKYNRDIEFDFLEELVNNIITPKHTIQHTTLWNNFKTFIENNGEQRRLDTYTSRKFHMNLKQKIAKKINRIEGFDNTILYGTVEKRLRIDNKDIYILDIDKLKKYFDIEQDD